MKLNERMSKEDAERIKGIVNELFLLVKSGEDPGSALENLAKKHDLLPEQVKLIGRAFNTARVLTKAASGGFAAEKVDEAHLINIPEVIEKVFREDEPAPEVERDLAKQAEDWYRSGLPALPAVIEEAYVSDPVGFVASPEEILNPYPFEEQPRFTPQDVLYKHASFTDAIEQLGEALVKCAQMLRLSAPPVVKEVARSAKVVFGPGFVAKILHTSTQLPDPPYVEPYYKSASDFPLGEFMGMLQNLFEGLVKTAHARKMLADYSAAASYELTGHIPEPGYTEEEPENFFSKKAVDITGMMGEITDIQQDVQELRDRIRDELRQSLPLERFRAKHMLRMMAREDPVLSRYSWPEIESAYRVIRQTFPNLTKKPGALRALVAHYLTYQGVLTPQDILNLYRAESQIEGKGRKKSED